MKKVMVFGTFDGLHQGHKYFLKKAKEYGDYLIVIVALDQTVIQIKKKLPLFNQEARAMALRMIPEVDKAIFGNPGDKHQIIRNEKPDIICLGYDQIHFTEKLQVHFPHIPLYRIDAHKAEKYKSSLLNKQKEFAEMKA